MQSHYFPYEMVPRYTDADHSYAINKMQIELVASRVSRHNDCFYWTIAHAGLLQAGGIQSETEVDVSIVVDGDRDGGVAHGAALLAFTDGAMTINASQIRETRAHLVGVAGERAMIDAAAIAAIFQLNTRAADAAGIPTEEPTLEGRTVMGERLGFAPRAEGKAPERTAVGPPRQSRPWRWLRARACDGSPEPITKR